MKAQHPCLVVGDTQDPAYVRVFDGVHTYNPVGVVAGGADLGAYDAQLVQTARRAGKISAATVIPGYDDTHIRHPGLAVATAKPGWMRSPPVRTGC